MVMMQLDLTLYYNTFKLLFYKKNNVFFIVVKIQKTTPGFTGGYATGNVPYWAIASPVKGACVLLPKPTFFLSQFLAEIPQRLAVGHKSWVM